MRLVPGAEDDTHARSPLSGGRQRKTGEREGGTFSMMPMVMKRKGC